MRVEGGGWRVEGGGWRVEGGGPVRAHRVREELQQQRDHLRSRTEDAVVRTVAGGGTGRRASQTRK